MREGRPSLTAAAVSFARGVGVVGDAPDPHAGALLPAPLSYLLQAYRGAGPARVPLRAALRGVSLGMVDHITLRTLAIDTALREAVAAGCRQVVILGAGLDARAWRMAELAGLAVYEVDHPDTQGYKRQHAPEGRPVAASLTYVPVDFERQRVGDELAAAGHDASVPTFWIWEGVTMYLGRFAIVASLGEVASRSAPGSRLAVTYVLPRKQPLGEQVERLVDAAFSMLGEPLIGALPSEEMQCLLEGAGFERRSDTHSRNWARTHDTSSALPLLLRSERLAVAERVG